MNSIEISVAQNIKNANFLHEFPWVRGFFSAPRRRDLVAEQKALNMKFGEVCSIHNSKMELFCEEVKCRIPVCSTCYIENHLGHKASLISNKVNVFTF